MTGLSKTLGRERRERYLEMRRQGIGRWEAATELGLDYQQSNRYERWYQAEVAAGHPIEPRPVGGRPGKR